jgi:GGDEF domain-containing protein
VTDWDVAEIQSALLDSATGFMSMNTFVFFLLRAWEQHTKDQTPFSAIVFEVAIRYPNGEIVPLPDEALPHLSSRLMSACSPLDVMAHVKAGEFLTLLSSTSSIGAQEFSRRLHATLTETPLLPGEDGQDLAKIHIGIASLPEHRTDPESLIAGARQAKDLAKSSNAPIAIYA